MPCFKARVGPKLPLMTKLLSSDRRKTTHFAVRHAGTVLKPEGSDAGKATCVALPCVALPCVRNEESELVPGEAQDRQSTSDAESLARKPALTSAREVAVSRTGEPATGEFEDAVVIPRLR